MHCTVGEARRIGGADTFYASCSSQTVPTGFLDFINIFIGGVWPNQHSQRIVYHFCIERRSLSSEDMGSKCGKNWSWSWLPIAMLNIWAGLHFSLCSSVEVAHSSRSNGSGDVAGRIVLEVQLSYKYDPRGWRVFGFFTCTHDLRHSRL